MIYLILFILMLLSGFFDAIGDSIKDIRTHFGDAGDALGRKGHPYRDFFHLCKYLERSALIGIGLTLHQAWWDDRIAWAIAVLCGLIIGRAVWNATYKQPEYWLALDERVRVRTGWKWLDKWLGIHW
jgi:hypothetical protein